MHIGILFPQTEIGNDPGGLREYARAMVDLGFDHLATYEHVLGAVPERLPRDYAPYGIEDAFHEPFTLFAHLAAVAPELAFITSILVLPQRQTALVAKQSVLLDRLTGGKFRLGVGLGWNFAEFEGMGCDFKTRAARLEEQVEVLRLLWSQDVVTFSGRFHQVQGLGLRPRPPHAIPIWIGARTEPAIRRAAVLGDGFLPLLPLSGGWEHTFDQMRQWREAAGKPWEGFGIEARVGFGPDWRQEAETWRQRGATHVYVSTMGQGRHGAQEHIQLLRELAREV
ncbi:MAG: LLM class F420-dependent oxidoreductase [Candidatus Xenobia bacterium]